MSPPASQPGPPAVERQADAQAPREPSARRPSRGWLYVASGVAAVWLLALAALTVLTANPVTLNRAQIASSDRIVTARLDGEDRLRIEKDWTAGPETAAPLPASLPVRNLARTGMRPGRSYIVPLRRGLSRQGADWWEVAPSPLPTDEPGVYKPLVYPATPEAIAQVEAILTGGDGRPPGSQH